jgi:putative tricarboxylic transport membrane protein
VNVKKGNMAIGTFGIALSFFVWIYSAVTFPRRWDNQIGPAFFPRLLSVGMILLCAALIVQTIRKVPQGEGFVFTPGNPAFRRILITFAACVVFGVLLKVLGFILCSVLLLFGLMYMMGNRKIPQMIGVSLITSLVVQLVFEKLLGIALPYGLLEPVFLLF